MSTEKILNVIGGLVTLGIGVRMIITQRATFNDEDNEPYMWVYGWRAVLTGAVFILVSLGLFASAAEGFGWLQ
jgi:hypothetical protein